MTSQRLTCHCGAVELSVTLANGLGTARRCDCSFCRRRAAATVTVHKGDLEVVRGAQNLTLYQWNTRTARHYFCKTCGIYTHHQRRSDPQEYGVNLGALENVNPHEHEPIAWVNGVNHPADR